MKGRGRLDRDLDRQAERGSGALQNCVFFPFCLSGLCPCHSLLSECLHSLSFILSFILLSFLFRSIHLSLVLLFSFLLLYICPLDCLPPSLPPFLFNAPSPPFPSLHTRHPTSLFLGPLPLLLSLPVSLSGPLMPPQLLWLVLNLTSHPESSAYLTTATLCLCSSPPILSSYSHSTRKQTHTWACFQY